jgi:hypothetical protein
VRGESVSKKAVRAAATRSPVADSEPASYRTTGSTGKARGRRGRKGHRKKSYEVKRVRIRT